MCNMFAYISKYRMWAKGVMNGLCYILICYICCFFFLLKTFTKFYINNN